MNSSIQDALALADETLTLAARIFDQRSIADDLETVVQAGHCLRMSVFASAVCDLIRAGHFEPACALSRTVLEAGWVLLAIRAHPEKFEEWLSHANSEGRRTIGRLRVLAEHERGPGMNDAEIEAAIASIPSGKSHPVKDWAAAAGTPQAYATIYQTLSGYSHAEMSAAVSYVEWDELRPVRVRSPDLGLQPADCLDICTALMLDACRAVAGDELSQDQEVALSVLEARRQQQTRRLDALRTDEVAL